MLSKKNVLIPLGIIGVTALIIAVMMNFNKSPGEGEVKEVEAKFVSTVSANIGAFKPMHKVIGKVEALEQIDVNAQVNAKVAQISVKNGDWVEKGQTVIVLDVKQAQRELSRLQAQLADAKANQSMQIKQHALETKLLAFDKKQLDNANAALAKEKNLFKNNLSSSTRVEQVEEQADLRSQAYLQKQLAVENQGALQEQTKAGITQLQLSIDTATDNLANHVLVADFSGQIANVNLKQGQQVSQGQLLFTLFNDQNLQFKTKVSEALANQAQSQLMINNGLYDIQSVNPLLESQSAAQSVTFDLTGSKQLIGSYQYANWVSSAIENSFLVEDKALFEFERIYYLKDEDQDFSLVEKRVTLHGSTLVDNKEYWIATAQDMPEEFLLLTSKISPLYSGVIVTDQIPELENNDDENVASNQEQGK